MPNWHEPHLGLAEFPKNLNDWEIEYFFTFKTQELEALKTRYKPLLRVAAAIQLGFLKMTGRGIEAIHVVPRKLLSHIGDQLGELAPTIASIRSLYSRRGRTLHDHRRWAVEFLKLSEPTERQERMLYARVKEMSNSLASIDRLILFARQWLYERKLLIPAERTLREMARRALLETEEKLHDSVINEVPEILRKRWEQEVFFEARAGTRSTAEWLDKGPARGVKKGIGEQVKKVEYLHSLDVHKYPLSDITVEKQRYFARRLRMLRRPSRIQTVTPRRRTLYIACFLRVALMRAMDSVLEMCRQRAIDLWRESREQATAEDARSALTYREAIHEISTITEDDDVNAEDARTQIRAVLEKLSPRVFKSRAAAARAKLLDKGVAVRAVLGTLTKLPLEGTPAEPVYTAIATLKQIYAEKKTTLDAEAEAQVRPLWRSELEHAKDDPRRRLSVFEAATLLDFRPALRRGTVWARDSFEFRDRERILIGAERWDKERKSHFTRLHVEESPEKHCKPFLTHIEGGLVALADSVERGDVEVRGDTLHIDPIEPEDVPKALRAHREELDATIGKVQMPRLMMEMDALVHWSTHLLGHPPRNPRELQGLYSAVWAHGTELDAAGVALMTPGVDAEYILRTMRGLEDERSFRRANQVLVDFMQKQPVSQYWGTGTTASSDMMNIDVSRRLYRARRDPRKKTPCVGIYQHVWDRRGIIYDMPLVIGDRQAGAALEGIIRQEEIHIERLAVDTHGYTDFSMGGAKILHRDICPRLKNLRERRLFVPAGIQIPEVLKPVADRGVSIAAMKPGWDDFIRVMASVDIGETSAVLAFERFGGAAARGDKVHTAGSNFGRLLRTVYLCDYYTIPSFRREIHRILNHGESVHSLKRQIYTGRMGPARGRRTDEFIAVSGALTLLANMVMSWTTYRMQIAIDQLRAADPARWTQELIATLFEHMLPTHAGNVNLRGLLIYPFDEYGDQIIQDAGKPRLTVVR